MSRLSPGLRFRNGAFKIVQFTDLHISTGADEDARTLIGMERVLDLESPELALFTGDNITGGQAPDAALALRMAVDPVLRRGLPFAVLFGNHDDEGALDRRGLLAVLEQLPGNLSQAGPVNVKGVGNQVLEIAGEDGRMAAALHCFDSHGYAGSPEDGYDWMDGSQMAWHQAQCRRLADLRPDWACAVPELAFFHIPLPQHKDAWEMGWRLGRRQETECIGRHDAGFFRALQGCGHVLAAFCGHDHLNDYVALHAGPLALGYGRAGGHGSYGSPDLPKGARLLLLREGLRDLATWLRLEDGSRASPLASLAELALMR